jgi:hypothetical protein
LGHHLGQLAAVLREDAPRKELADAAGEGLDRFLGGRERRTARGQLQLDLARSPQDRRPRVRERLVERGQDLLDLALPHRRDAQDAGLQDGASRVLAQHRPDLLVEHRLHLAGRAGKQDEGTSVRLHPLPGRRPAGVREHDRPLDHVGLLLVDGGHGPAVAGEAGLQGLEDLPIAREAPPERGRRGLPGQVVLGRPEPAGGDHDVGPHERRTERRFEQRAVVGDGHARADLDADLEEPAREVGRVRFQAQRREQLASHREDLRPQRHAAGKTRRTTRTSRFA